MKRLLLSLCMVLALVACKDEKKDTTQASTKPVVKIGAILPLTGSQASMGEAAKAGMQKALKERSKSDLHYSYELVFEDNQAKLPSMLPIANKLVMQDNVDVMGTITTAMARVIAPVSDQKEKVLYAFSIEQEKYQRFGKYAFIQGTSIEALSDKFVESFAKNNQDNISIFVENIGVLGPLTLYLKEKLTEKGIRYQINEFNPGETDFRLVIEKAKNEGYTNFGIFAFPPERNIIIRQSAEAGIDYNNFYSFSLDMDNVAENYDGIKTITYNCGTEDFVESIQKEYNIDSTYGSAEFYDFVNIMIDAYEHLYKEGQKPTAEEITAYIHNKIEFPCMSGQCVVRPNGFIINDPVIRIHQGGKWVTIRE